MLAERIGSSQLAEMSAQGASLTTTLRPGNLPRLAGTTGGGQVRPDGALEVTIRFSIGPESFPVVQIRVTGTVDLTCQRCLGPVGCPLELDVALTMVGSEADAEALADPFDSIVLDEEGGLRLRMAVEDEILAALPLVPLHGEGAGCTMMAGTSAAAEMPVRTANRPFAGLAALMDQDRGDDRGT
jgi:uncharacterized protein